VSDVSNPAEIRDCAQRKLWAIRYYVRLRRELIKAEKAQQWMSSFITKLGTEYCPKALFHPLACWWSKVYKEAEEQHVRAVNYEQYLRKQVEKASKELLALGVADSGFPEVYGKITIWRNPEHRLYEFGYDIEGQQINDQS